MPQTLSSLFLYLLYLWRLFTNYVLGKTEDLSRIVRLEEGFYHDLKGLYSKRLGLPITKYRAGTGNHLVEEDIRAGALEIIRQFGEVRAELFGAMPPDLRLVRIYLTLGRLKAAASSGRTDTAITLLQSLKEQSDAFYAERVEAFRFDLSELLSQIMGGFRHSPDIELAFKSEGPKRSLRLPYADFNTWRRLFHNFIQNAIEAVEVKGKGRLTVRLSFPDKDTALVEIEDTGIGMDAETLASFAKRGFTKGKTAGQGLGVNEESLSFINTHGGIDVSSSPGTGTSIRIEIDPAKNVKAQLHNCVLFFLAQRKLRMAGTITLATIGLFLLSTSFESMRFWPADKTREIYKYELLDTIPGSDSTAFGSIKALDKDKNEIWTLRFPASENIPHQSPVYAMKPLVTDIDLDGQNEIIIPVSYKTYFGEKHENDEVVCISNRKAEEWEYRFESPSRPIFDFGLGQEGMYFCLSLAAFDLSGKETQILLTTASGAYYPTQVLLLDGFGNKQKEYWHAGQVFPLGEAKDYDNDGKVEFVLYGENNRMGWSPVIMLMEYDDFEGQSMPYIDSVFEYASEECYYVFGHAWIGDIRGFSTKGVNCNTVGFKGATITPAEYPEYYIDFLATDGRTVRFNRRMEFDTILVDRGEFTKFWRERSQNIGGTYRHWTEEDIAQLYGYKRYERGVLMADSIFINRSKYDWSSWQNR